MLTFSYLYMKLKHISIFMKISRYFKYQYLMSIFYNIDGTLFKHWNGLQNNFPKGKS